MGRNTAAIDATFDTVALDQLNNSEAKSLLDTIDSLRELQVGEIVNLPQIIVVGDQSSGKSSVLEAISQVKFPVKGDLCTRFATELVLRRASESSIQVRIQFANEAGRAGTSEPFRRTSFDKNALPEIINEAKERMGIRVGSMKGFSKDILRVEIAGPEVYPLTLVDLPGFFHTETADQSQEGKDIVDQLVESYMKQKNSIILAVVSANNQLANQVVLAEAKKHDPTKERTLGVITKPDLLKSGLSDERKYLELAKGHETAHRLRLGWHVLRNRSEEDETSATEDRDTKEEAFFKTGVWSSISPFNRGVGSLRKKLSKVLLTHIQKSLPGVIADIETNLRTRQDELERLGKPRATPDDFRSYLLDIADSFQRLAREAVDGRYNDTFFGDLSRDDRKLRALLRNLNRAFFATMISKGASQKIIWDDEKTRLEAGKSKQPERIKIDDQSPDYLQPFVEFYKFEEPQPILESQLRSNLQRLASANQGKEFPGMPNRDLVIQLFKAQSLRWKDIAKFHLDLVTNFSKTVVEQLVSHVIGADTDTITAILRDCVDPFFDAKKALIEAKLEELLRPYTAGFGLPLEEEFHSRLSERTRRRFADQVVNVLEAEYPSVFSVVPKEWLSRQKLYEAVVSADKPESSEFGTEKAIQMMMAYYDMSLRTFVENVINLAVENCLVCDIPDILTPRKVDRMNEAKLKALASESEEVQSERKTLEDQARILRDGLQKCQQYRPREIPMLPSSLSNLSVSGIGGWPASRSVSPLPTPAPTLSGSTQPTSILTTTSSTPTTENTSQKQFSTEKMSFEDMLAMNRDKAVPEKSGSLTSAGPKLEPKGGPFSHLASSVVPSQGSGLLGSKTEPNSTVSTTGGLYGTKTNFGSAGSTASSIFSSSQPSYSAFKPAEPSTTKSLFGASAT